MYPSLYYAIKDLLGLDLPFLKMFQSFGFFVALAFLASAWLLSKELKRKEMQGLLGTQTIKVLKGQGVTPAELAVSGIIGFVLGFKGLYVILNFSKFTDDTQGFLLSSRGNILGGLILAAGFVYFKYREFAKTKTATPTTVEEVLHPYQLVGNITLIAALSGLIGAKIFHNLENWDDFVKDPIGALLSFSGLTMYGGLICASIACIYYGRKNKIAVKHLIDAAAPSIMIGYAIGRIGCHVAGDGDWGVDNIAPKPGWLSWAPDWMWSYDYPHNVNSVGEPMADCVGKYCNHLVPNVYPTAFYETIMCFILFFVLWKIRKRITTPGLLFSIYLILNGVERFFIEKIRVNTLYHIGNFAFTQAELISTLLFFTGIAGVWYFKKLEKKSKA